MTPRGRFALALAALALGSGAPAQTVPSEWLRIAPTPRAATEIVRGAEGRGWPAMATALRDAALRTYATGNLEAAAAWRNAARWARAWADTPADLDAETRSWLLGDAGFSEAYFELENPADDHAAVWRILARLRARDGDNFKTRAALGLAIAIVYDAPPPLSWPHWQVKAEALPRRLPAPEEAWDYFIALDKAGRGLHRLDRLDATELRFLVDLALPDEERRWARERVKTPLARLEETYGAVAYREDRIAAGEYVWPGRRYTLAGILAEGGICVDQAYFAAQAGKARGVPTLLFGGAGRDGRHAWFGFLGVGRKWRLDAGRYEEQRFVTGEAIDPQTWATITDHELAFLSEGFRRMRTAREAAAHGGFARWLFQDGRPAEAETAARAAVRLERRTLDAWDVLLDLRPEAGAARETVAREAAAGLTAYPDLQSRFLALVEASLRTRGETAEAERIGRELTRRMEGKRDDLGVARIAEQLAAAAATSTPAEQVKLYRAWLRDFGRGGGAALWDRVARPLAGSLVRAGNLPEAREVLAATRAALAPAPGSQLDGELRDAAEAIAARASAAAPTP